MELLLTASRGSWSSPLAQTKTPPAAGFFCKGCYSGIEEVAGPVGAGVGVDSHGACDDHRNFLIEEQVEHIGTFCEGGGAHSKDYAVGLACLSDTGAFPGIAEKVLGGEDGAAHIGHLNNINFGQASKLWHSLDQACARDCGHGGAYRLVILVSDCAASRYKLQPFHGVTSLIT